MLQIFLVILLLKFTITIKAAEDAPIVTIPALGQVEGRHARSLSGVNFFSFEGIPYAQAPLGKYRFREPQPVKPWRGVWPAKIIYKCMQYFQYTPRNQDFVVGDEDCLYLNLYTPTLDTQADLDVVVYIHGGAFMFNYGGFQQPDFIMDKNVVYISMNYRLGPLGFLTTEDDLLPGNNGMKDQILALEWIQMHVKNFGGNAKSVTIIGMSAGGASIHFHYLSPKSRNLFHKGISQSGTMLNPWVLMENGLAKTQQLAANLGCSTENNERMIECLRKRPGKQIVNSVKIFQPWLYNPFSPFGIVVDSWSSNPVMPEHPYTLLKKGQVADLPWIASYTNSEGLYPGSDFYADDLNYIDSNWNKLMPFILDYNYTLNQELHNEVSQKIREKYLAGKNLSKKNYMNLINILSDRHFIAGIRQSVDLQLPATSAPIYMYYFTYRGTHSRSESQTRSNENFGAAHADDVSYLFKTNMDVTSTEEDRQMVKLMVDLVVSFAKNGKPDIGVEWPPLTKDKKSLDFMWIAGAKNLSITELIFDNAKFWKSLPFKENDKLFIPRKDEL